MFRGLCEGTLPHTACRRQRDGEGDTHAGSGARDRGHGRRDGPLAAAGGAGRHRVEPHAQPRRGAHRRRRDGRRLGHRRRDRRGRRRSRCSTTSTPCSPSRRRSPPCSAPTRCGCSPPRSDRRASPGCAEQADGLPLLDAPVLGTKKPAEEGNLVPLVSGPALLVETARPVLDAIGSRTVVVGEELGAASALKLACNAWIASITAATRAVPRAGERARGRPRAVPRGDRRRTDRLAVRAAQGQGHARAGLDDLVRRRRRRQGRRR